METRSLGPLTLTTIAMVAINAATYPALLIAYHLSPEFYELHSFSDLPYAWVDGLMLLWLLATVVVFGWWMVRAGSNLIALGYSDLKFTPAARIWWFAVPIANLFKPYQGMLELWNASHGKANLGDISPLVATWWALWLCNTFGLRILGLFAGPLDPPAPVWIQAIGSVALASTAIPMLLGITRAQAAQRGPALTDIFA